MKRIFVPVVVLTAALALAAQTLDLKVKPKVDDAKKYAVHLDFDFSGMQGTFNAELTHTVQSIDESTKNYKLKVEMKDGLAEVAGASQPVEVPAYVAEMTPNNQIVKVSGEGSDANTIRYARALVPAFSPTPVEAIDGKTKWIVKDEAKDGTPAWEQTVTYLGREPQEGVDCVKLAFELKEPSGDNPLTSKGTAWVDPVDGTTVKVMSELSKYPVQGYVIDAKASVIIKK